LKDGPISASERFLQIGGVELGRIASNNGPTLLPSVGTAQALHLRLSQPHPVEPMAGTRGWPQSRGDLAAATTRPAACAQMKGNRSRCARNAFWQTATCLHLAKHENAREFATQALPGRDLSQHRVRLGEMIGCGGSQPPRVDPRMPSLGQAQIGPPSLGDWGSGVQISPLRPNITSNQYVGSALTTSPF
jgi:hypothetical protein